MPLLPLLHKFVLQTLLDRLAARLSAETHFHVADVRLHFYRAFNYYRFPSSTYNANGDVIDVVIDVIVIENVI